MRLALPSGPAGGSASILGASRLEQRRRHPAVHAHDRRLLAQVRANSTVYDATASL